MSAPHTCPTCHGTKRVGESEDQRPCPTCDATGVVWDHSASPEEAAAGGGDPLAINGL